jgi:prepilin-type N-terminal cleavage/methylation domain-containing protein
MHLANDRQALAPPKGSARLQPAMIAMTDDRTPGFTLLEIVIGVAIVGILAAVAVVQLLNFRERAGQAAVLALADGTRAALAAFAAADPNHLFPTATGDVSATLATHGITLPPGTTVAYTPLGTPPGSDYHMTLTNTTSGKAACVAPSGVLKDACP